MHLNKKLLISIILLPCISFSQGAIFDKGQSGGSILYGHSDAENGTVESGTFVSTTKGFFDFGITLASIDPDGPGDNLKLFGVQAEIYPLREGNSGGGIPINLSVLGIWSNSGPDNINSYGYGGTIFKRLSFGERVFITPIFSLIKLWPLGSDYDSEIVTEFDFPFVLIINPKLRLSITPAFSLSESEDLTTFFIGLSFVGPKKKEKDK